MGKLFHKLDALVNYHYTPKLIQVSAEHGEKDDTVHKDISVIQMEEVIPMGIATTKSTAPQDTFKSKDMGLPVSQTELSHEEKQRKHRRKKRLFKKRQRQKGIVKMQQGKTIEEIMNARNVISSEFKTRGTKNKKAKWDNVKYANSTAVFAKIQQVQEQEQSKTS